MKALTFEKLRAVNVSRSEAAFFPVDHWSPAEWACALAGEAGETCNAVKHLDPVHGGTVADVAKELADTVIYCDLLAARLGINLGEAVRDKFNEVSMRRNVPHRL